MTAPPIVSVTVHPDGAMVRRRGTLPCRDGQVLVGGLPLLLDTSSLRVAVEGGTLREQRLGLSVPDQQGGDEHALEALQATLEAHATCMARHAALEAERATVRALSPRYQPDADPPTAEAIEAWGEAEDVLGPWADRIDADLRAVRKEAEALSEQLEARRLAVHQASSESWWRQWMPGHALTLAVDEGAEQVQVEVSYRIGGATWSPSYLLVCDGDLASARFAMRAVVVQATGEDWADAALAVSTAPCRRRVDLPKLPSMRLGTRQPPAPPAWRPLPPGLDALFPDPLPPLPAPTPDADDTEVTASADEPDTLILSRQALEAEARAGSAKPLPPPPPAPAAAPMVMASAPPPRRSRVARSTAGAMPRAEAAPMAKKRRPPPDGVQADPDHLDFHRLRLAGPEAGPGVRGRLQPLRTDAWLAEAGLPPAGRRRYHDVVQQLREAMGRARDRALPPHHVRPGPVKGADTVFRTSGTVHLPSDGRFHSVALFEEPLRLTTRYVAVPRHDPRVYRRVTASLQRSEPLLPGPVEVLVDGALELTTPWEGSAHAGALQMHLGVEDRLSLARNVRYDEASVGMFGGRRKLSTAIEVTVASAMGSDVEVEVLERVPVVPESADATVEIEASSPRAVPYEGRPDAPVREGIVRQRLPVAAKGSATARLTYAVTLNSKDEIVGGDRRG